MVKMAGMAGWFKRHSLLLLIVTLGLAFRLTQFREWFQFEMDEEVIAWKTRQFWQDGKPFLIGGGTPFGFHLGPAFYYLSAIPLFITNGDPIGWSWLAALVSILTLYLMWLVGKNLFDRQVGLISALLWATSFTAVMNDRHWWPLVLNPLLTLLVVLSLWHILHQRTRWWIPLGVVLSLAWQTDLSTLPLLFATGIVVVKSGKIHSRYLIVAMATLFLSVFPLVIFEYRHPGSNLGKLLTHQFRLARGTSIPVAILDTLVFVPSALGSLLLPLAASPNLATFYTWCKDLAWQRMGLMSPLLTLMAAAILVYPMFLFLKRNKPAGVVLSAVIVAFVIGFVAFRIFGGDLFDFYLAGLYPVFLLSSAAGIWALIRRFRGFRWGVAGSVAATVLLNLNFSRISFHPQGLAIKQQAVAWAVRRVEHRQFALESISRCSRYNGIRYLFMQTGIEPSISFMDPNLSWLYDRPPTGEYPGTFVVFVTPDDLSEAGRTRYNLLAAKAYAREQFGAIEVLIASNDDRSLTIDF